MITRTEYLWFRDTYSIEGYKLRWPILKAREMELRAAIAHLEATERPKVIDDAKRDKAGVYFELQRVTAQMSEMKKDWRQRRRNLKALEAA